MKCNDCICHGICCKWEDKQKGGCIEQEPCEDAISRQAVIDIAGVSDWFESSDSYNDFVNDLYKLPPVTPKPKTGHWIWCVGSHRCSNCEEYTWFSHKELLKYCPNCGAKMVEQQESEET